MESEGSTKAGKSLYSERGETVCGISRIPARIYSQLQRHRGAEFGHAATQVVQFQQSTKPTSSAGSRTSRSHWTNGREPPHLSTSRSSRRSQAVYTPHGCQHSGGRTQEVENRKEPAGYASMRLSWTNEMLSCNGREVLGMLCVRAAALQGLPSTSSDYPRHGLRCADVAFISQTLSSKTHRWALKMMAYNMVLKWHKGID